MKKNPDIIIQRNMFCPRCSSRLIPGEGTRRYETLIEHVSSNHYDYLGEHYTSKIYYICSNDTCPTRKVDCFWDDLGDFYGTDRTSKDWFVLGMPEALNSCMRSSKLSQKRQYITLLHLFWIKFGMELSPIPNTPGTDISGFKIKPRIYCRTHVGWSLYLPGIYMLWFCIKSFLHARKRYLEDSSIVWAKEELIKDFEVPSWDKRWWKLLSTWIFNKVYGELKEELTCSKK